MQDAFFLRFFLFLFYLNYVELIFTVTLAMGLLVGRDDLSKGKYIAVCRSCTPTHEKAENRRNKICNSFAEKTQSRFASECFIFF